jgi:iron complex outermembrane receptor protein
MTFDTKHKTGPQIAARAHAGAPTRHRTLGLLALALGLGSLGAAQAQSTPGSPADTASLEPVVIIGSTRERKLVDAPYAITAIGAAELRGSGPQVNLSEALVRVPGLTVANRSNYAQDLQISSRGFGARAGFGVRGLRMYADGIPATMPDGQGQVAHFDLAGAQRIEVLRGPFSALYGNSSGGVIALFSAPVNEAASDVSVDFGSFGLRQQRLALASPVGQNVDLSASLSKFEIDGFRPHSAATRQLANVRLGFQSDSDRFVLQASNQDQRADDPLGMSRALFDSDPRATTPEADQFRTRKTIRQTQIGLAWNHKLGLGALDSLAVSTYAGSRGVLQYLAIPFGTQNGVRHGGGVIDFDRVYSGLDTRLSWRLTDLDIVTGVNVEQQIDERRGYLSFTQFPVAPATTPAPDYGNQGALKRNERNQAITREAYAQAEWALSPAVSATLGLRSGQVVLSTADRFPTPFTAANGDDSGSVKYKFTSPVAGLRFAASPALTLHASVSRGFESPTLGELAYQAVVPPATVPPAGFNLNLKAQTSRQAELGAKWRAGAGLPELDAAIFDIATSNEIATLTNAGGRASFQNVGHTSRKGLEVGTRWRVSPTLSTQLALTRLEARYEDDFQTCRNTPCQVATAKAGNRIAGTQPTSFYAELAWKPDAAGELALEVRGQGRTPVNDLNDDFASGYAITNLRYSRRIQFGQADRIELLSRVDNVTGRSYAGSVIVNDGNNRFFEPGAPRNYLASVRWHHSW